MTINSQTSLFERIADCLRKLGQNFEKFIQNSFRKYGTICSRKPFIFILPLIGITLASGLSIGILTNFQTMTDPVSLWSATDSRARIEKGFFDDNFNPFYRVQQIIIHPINDSTIIHFDPNDTTKYTVFGPAFEKEFLLQVLDLQLKVTNITTQVNGKTVVLEDLCFSPMKNKLCATQTPLGWFQNKASLLDKVVGKFNYLDHINACLKSDLNLKDDMGMSCAAPYGGPMIPNVALADFDGTVYSTAKAVVITITLNNHVKNEDNARALAWEQEFLEFMKNYKNPYMKFVYYSEVCYYYSLKSYLKRQEKKFKYTECYLKRSIEDELERQSKSSLVTIAISYLVMFAYISIALGEFTSVKRLFVSFLNTLKNNLSFNLLFLIQRLIQK
jgi:Niemann-Pick C1 protein